MKKIYFMLAAFFVSGVVGAQTISTGLGTNEKYTAAPLSTITGAQKITVSSPSADTLIEMGRDPSLDSDTPLEFYTYNNYASLLDLEAQHLVPGWFVDEILTDNNVSRADLTGDLLTKHLPQESIDIQGMNFLIAKHNEMLAHPELDWGCKSSWHDKHKSINKPIGKPIDKKSPEQKDTFLTQNSSFKGTTTVNIDIDYQLKSNSCIGIPYRAKLVKTTLDFQLTVEAQNSEALISKSTSTSTHVIDPQKTNLWDYSDGFWVWIFYIDYEFALNLEYGIDFETAMQVNVGTKSSFSGTIHKKWSCTTDSCEKEDMADDGGINMTDPTFDASIQGDFKLKPYVDVSLFGHVGLYKLDFATFVDATVGVRAEMPIRYFFYAGNTCSDADGDGKNEYINTQLIDVTAYLYGYLKYDGVAKGYKNFPIKVAGWTAVKAGEHSSDTGVKDLNATLYQKNIYFREMGDKKIFDPVLVPPKPFNQTGSTLGVSKRSCYPLDAEPTYLINWGDNSSDETKAGAIPHSYATTGYKSINAKILKDEAGRTFDDSAGTTVNLTVGTNGTGTTTPQFQAWLIPVINLILF